MLFAGIRKPPCLYQSILLYGIGKPSYHGSQFFFADVYLFLLYSPSLSAVWIDLDCVYLDWNQMIRRVNLTFLIIDWTSFYWGLAQLYLFIYSCIRFIFRSVSLLMCWLLQLFSTRNISRYHSIYALLTLLSLLSRFAGIWFIQFLWSFVTRLSPSLYEARCIPVYISPSLFSYRTDLLVSNLYFWPWIWRHHIVGALSGRARSWLSCVNELYHLYRLLMHCIMIFCSKLIKTFNKLGLTGNQVVRLVSCSNWAGRVTFFFCNCSRSASFFSWFLHMVTSICGHGFLHFIPMKKFCFCGVFFTPLAASPNFLRLPSYVIFFRSNKLDNPLEV